MMSASGRQIRDILAERKTMPGLGSNSAVSGLRADGERSNSVELRRMVKGQTASNVGTDWSNHRISGESVFCSDLDALLEQLGAAVVGLSFTALSFHGQGEGESAKIIKEIAGRSAEIHRLSRERYLLTWLAGRGVSAHSASSAEQEIVNRLRRVMSSGCAEVRTLRLLNVDIVDPAQVLRQLEERPCRLVGFPIL